MQKNTRHARHDGFTIVELLVVVVVIAILATITIVSYNGVIGRAKTVQVQSTSRLVVERIELWHSLMGSYPTYGQLVTNSIAPTGDVYSGYVAGGAAGPQEAKLPSGINILEDDYPPEENQISMITCTEGPGGAVVYRDRTDGTSGFVFKEMYWGGGSGVTYGHHPNC